METLFNQLKTEIPENVKISESTNSCESKKASKRSSSPESHKDLQTLNKTKKLSTANESSDNFASRRESMPPPDTTFVKKNKSRSLSPPKGLLVRPFKVLIERKKLVDIDGRSLKLGKTSQSSAPLKRPVDLRGSILKNGEKSPKKVTPTKAQQKLFDPAVLVKAQQLTQFNVKRCKVRLLRQDLAQMKEEFHAKEKKQMQHKKSSLKTYDKNIGYKRTTSSEKTSTSKREGVSEETESKHSAEFFIKINELNRSPKSKEKVEKSLKDKKSSLKLSAGAIAKKVNAAAAISSIKPTKFTRTQLIKMYGKRVFCSRVKIERCSHPMMMIFESNARARRLQAKRSKSKNLSVSFRDQVEIFGDSSDSEEADISPVYGRDIASTSEEALKSANPIPISLTATPARLKKVENGKVVDDIELDPSLFVVPIEASTPFVAPAKKKREKKSFSPLKGDGSPSPRKEQLKLANEKMPPSSLRRLTAVEVDEDDEDDECEYIVPIDIPERRISRTSSISAIDDVDSEKPNEASNSELDPIPIDRMCNTNAVEDSSGESFASAIEQPFLSNEGNASNQEAEALKNIENAATTSNAINEVESIKNNKDMVVETKTKVIDTELSELPQLTRIETVSPSQLLRDVVTTFMSNENAVDSKAASEIMKDNCELISNTNNIEEADIDKQTGDLSIIPLDTNLQDTLDDDISLRLFVDDDNTANSNFLVESEIVDGIVKERIDEISKDKPLVSSSEAMNLLSSKVTIEG